MKQNGTMLFAFCIKHTVAAVTPNSRFFYLLKQINKTPKCGETSLLVSCLIHQRIYTIFLQYIITALITPVDNNMQILHISIEVWSFLSEKTFILNIC